MLKSEKITLARELVTEAQTKKGEQPATMARRLKVNPAIFTHLFKENADELLSDEMLLKIINDLRPKMLFKKVDTANHATIQNICKEEKRKHRFVCILGYPGAGKTAGLDHYNRHNGNVWVIECNSVMNRKQFFGEILSKMGINFKRGSLYDMIAAIITELNQKENPLLIFDEASKLRQTILLDLHYLRNATMQNAGIILAGVDYFYENLLKAAQRDKEGIPELLSRLQAKYTLEPPTKAEITEICKANGVTDEQTIKEFVRIKNFRELSNAILNETDESLS